MYIKVPVKVYKVYRACEKCGRGVYKRDGSIVLTAYPPQYPHKCDACGDMRTFPLEYPCIEYEQTLENM